ncbi:MAG: hypothetical protein JXQ72_17345 [Anaerolineae bacterium]|nr:hypothetical protein [Anaerolineae bacterium]
MIRRTRFVLNLVLILILLLAVLPVAAQSDTGDDADAIRALVAAMEDAVIDRDRATYETYVDWSDPVFASEHTYWINDWAGSDPLDRFSMSVDAIQVDGDTATGSMMLQWALLPNTSYRIAEFPVQFTLSDDGQWYYAGEAFVSVEAEHFLVRATPGMENVATELIKALPDIYTHATASLDHTTDAIVEIKLYPDANALGAMIALSLPPIRGWNEPGESLKMLVEEGTLPSSGVLAHELTHFLTFDMAGTTRGLYPWWLMEGIAQVVSEEFREEDNWGADQIAYIRDLYLQGELAPWDQISDFEETPVNLWRLVYPQGYVFTRYVTEVYGERQRNNWLRDMAGDLDIDAATEHTLGLTFEELDQGFGEWLVAALEDEVG